MTKMATMLRGHGGAIGVSGFPAASSSSCFTQNAKFPSVHSTINLMASRLVTVRPSVVVACTTSAVQETAASAAEGAEESKEAKVAPKPAAAKAKAPKVPVKKLPLMMEEDIIPPLKSILESQAHIADIELSFQDDKLEGSFVHKGIPHHFWAFFPEGLTGPKGFALSSYGGEASTVEPFLIDERKVTAKHVVFWVKKRLVAQGIIPVWRESAS